VDSRGNVGQRYLMTVAGGFFQIAAGERWVEFGAGHKHVAKWMNLSRVCRLAAGTEPLGCRSSSEDVSGTCEKHRTLEEPVR
jgi:hypothetical protein